MKFHLIIISVWLWTCNHLWSQEAPIIPHKSDQQRWSIGASASIDYCNRHLVNRTDEDDTDEVIDVYNNVDIATPGFSVGLALKKPLGSKINLLTGLKFSRSGYQTKCFDDWQWPLENEDGQWVPNNSSPDLSFKFIYRSYYIDLPILFQLYTNAEKQKWFFTGGLSPSFFLKETTTSVITENGDTRRNTDNRNYDYTFMNVTPEIGFGKQFSFSKSTFQLSSNFRYGLFPLRDTSIGIHLWSVGLNMIYYWTASVTQEP